MKTHHISNLTGDFKRNFNFYVNVLGLRFIKNSINQANAHMRHVYYGDFLGSAGTVITFFADEKLDRPRVDGKMFFQGVHFAIPKGSIDFWQKRLSDNGFEPSIEGDMLKVNDPDNIPLELSEKDDVLFDWHINLMSDIEPNKQVLGIIGTELHVPDVEQTAKFFHDLLELPTVDNVVQMEDGQHIRLYQTPTDAPGSKFGSGSIDHFALGVKGSAELDILWQRAKEQGWKREVYVDRGYFNSTYFIEPGGTRVEIATSTPGFTLDESVEDLGTTFALPPRFDGDREQLRAWWHEHGVDFDDAKPYTGTGKVNNEPVKPEFDERGNTYNG